MSEIFQKSIACADQIKKLFNETGELVDSYVDAQLGIEDLVFSSNRYRRAHISIVDARDTKKLWLLHCTVFPHTDDNSPIYGFDIVAGPSKVSGAFHDFSSSGNSAHEMLGYFADRTRFLDWNKKRELPEWAKNIFSSSMVAIGAVGETELDAFTSLGLETLEYYLKHVGLTQEALSDFHMAQNRYCHYQKQNPHTPRVLVNLGFTEQQAKDFVATRLFPETY